MTEPLVLSFAQQTDEREVVVRINAGRRSVGAVRFFCRTGQRLQPTADALLCLGLYPACEVGAPLVIAGSVDPQLLQRSAEIMQLFRTWWPPCREIAIHANAGHPEKPSPNRGSGLFFSGGVDSSFSLLAEREQLAAVVTLLGADVSLANTPGMARLERVSHEVAQANNMAAVVVQTNARDVFHPFASWIEHHGSVLAAIGHLMQPHLARVLIASSGNEASLHSPWGSHPALDPMLGSASVRIEHHGLVCRFDKIAQLIGNETIMRHLRVCNRSTQNCGACDKCAFVMYALDILGVSDHATTFPSQPLPHGKLRIVDDAFATEVSRLQSAAEASGHHEIATECRRTLVQYQRNVHWHRINRGWRIRSRVLRHRLRWKRAGR